MTGEAFKSIAAGLKDAIAFAKGDTAKAKVHAVSGADAEGTFDADQPNVVKDSGASG